jgi:hypothetical protein
LHLLEVVAVAVTIQATPVLVLLVREAVLGLAELVPKTLEAPPLIWVL